MGGFAPRTLSNLRDIENLMSETGLPPGQEADGRADYDADRHGDDLPVDRGEQGFEQAREQANRNRPEPTDRAERRIQQLLRENREKEAELNRLREGSRRMAMSSIDGAIAAEKAKLKKAFEDGDAEAHAAATERLASLQADKRVVQHVPATQAGQQVEYTPATQAWIDRNPRYLTDPKFQQAASKADAAARAAGFRVDTPEYFAFVEERIDRELPGAVVREDGGERVEEQMAHNDEPARPASRTTTAPVQQRQRPQSGPGQRVVTVIPADYRKGVEEGARATGMDPAKYWLRAQEMAKRGDLKLESLRNFGA